MLLFQGGVGCGKTHAACLLGLELSFERTGAIGMVVAHRWATLRDAIIPMYRRLLQAIGYVEGQDYTYRVGTRSLNFANGSRILFRPLWRSLAYQSLECQWMHAEELGELSEAIFAKLLTRIRQPNGGPLRFFGTATPTSGWLQERFAAGNPSGYRKCVGQTAENTVLGHVYEDLVKTTYPSDEWSHWLEGNDWPPQPEAPAPAAKAKPVSKKPSKPPAVETPKTASIPDVRWVQYIRPTTIKPPPVDKATTPPKKPWAYWQ